MRITEDILKALQNCINGVGSITEFSQQTNVAIETISKYLSRQSRSIQKETWDKIHPMLQPYLPKSSAVGANQQPRPNIPASTKHNELTCDEKILLDAFAELPKAVRDKMLLDIVEQAKLEIQKKNGGN